MRTKSSTTIPSLMLVVSVWATVLVTEFLGLQLLETLTLLYATVMSSLVLFFMLKSRYDALQLQGPKGSMPLAPLQRSMNKIQPKA